MKSLFNYFFVFLLTLFGVNSADSQCSVDSGCLEYNISTYHCLQSGSVMFLSDFITPSGTLPSGGGFVNLIIDGILVMDVDYTFDSGSHILLTPGSEVSIGDGNPNNSTGPVIAITDGSLVSSCEGYWDDIRLTDPGAELIIQLSTITNGENGIFIDDQTTFTSENSDYHSFDDDAFGIIIGDDNEPTGQDITVTIRDNTFEDIQRPLTIVNTIPLSLGEKNVFTTTETQSSSWAAIFLSNSSLSIAKGNSIDGYYRGIIHYSDPDENHFLSMTNMSIKNTSQEGIRAGGEIFSNQFTSGLSLFVYNSTFEDCSTGIFARIRNGGKGFIYNNDFLDAGTFSGRIINLIGDLPSGVSITENEMNTPVASGGIRVSMPLWDAGDKVQISDNILNVNQQEGILLNLGQGGIIENNSITSSNNIGIWINPLTPGVTISDNDIEIGTGDGLTGSGIVLVDSPNAKIVCNTTDGNNAGGGLLFLGDCDGAIISQNTMENHVRGLTIYSYSKVGLYGVTGPQVYRDNVWNGGSTAEAYMGAYFSGTIPNLFKILSQFTINQNTGSIWPSPIIPSQSVPGGVTDWIRYEYNPSHSPELCGDILEEEVGLAPTPFQEEIIDQNITEPTDGEGKYRDLEFKIYQLLMNDTSLIDTSNQAYFDSINTTEFLKRYQVEAIINGLSVLTDTIPVQTDTESLLAELSILQTIDTIGISMAERDSVLAEVHTIKASIDTTISDYDSTSNLIVQLISTRLAAWSPTELSDSILHEVLTIYFDNFGTPFEDYTTADQNAIENTADLCMEKYGKGVTLANAIAGTLFDYDPVSACSPPPPQNPVNTREEDAKKFFTVFPSPTTGTVYIEQNTPASVIKFINVMDSRGQIVSTISTYTNNSINLSDLPSGLYFIAINTADGQRQIEKILLQK